MKCEPANSLIKRLGGTSRVAELRGLNISTVCRWRMPREKGGTGGVIPHWHASQLIGLKDQDGKLITPIDFLPRKAPQHGGAQV